MPMVLAPGPEEAICSARKCPAAAKWSITWSNPTIPYGRSKIWLSCDQHLLELRGYFDYRGFPYQVAVFTGPATDDLSE